MVKLLFICHGNICRSPMAEFIMKDLAERAGVGEKFEIASAAVSREEIGNPVYPPARRELARRGVPCGGHAARQLRREDYGRYDLLIGMDRSNLRAMERICGGDPEGKLHLLLEYAAGAPKGTPAEPRGSAGEEGAGGGALLARRAEAEGGGPCFGDVADPWYTGDFERAYEDIRAGCAALLEAIRRGVLLRRAREADLPAILAVVEEGRRRIRALGIDQWPDGYPGESDFQADIAGRRCWVAWDAEGVSGVMAVTVEPEAAYAAVDGAWLQTGGPYGAIHRMAVADRTRGSGAAAALEARAEEEVRRAGGVSIRCDTHLGNTAMDRFLRKMGFSPCGVVVYPDILEGDPRRMAYEKLL